MVCFDSLILNDLSYGSIQPSEQIYICKDVDHSIYNSDYINIKLYLQFSIINDRKIHQYRII